MNSPVAEAALGGTLLFTALGVAVVMNPKTRHAGGVGGSTKNKAEAVAAFAGIGAVVGLAIGVVVKAIE